MKSDADGDGTISKDEAPERMLRRFDQIDADGIVPVMIDGTEKTPEFERLRKKYKVVGLPAVYFVCPKGEVVSELTLKGFEPADMFLRKMNDALAACSSEATDAG